MRRWKGSEVLVLVFAALMLLSGILGICYPDELIIPHATTSLRARPATLVERVSPSGTRIYGSLAVVSSLVIAGFVFWSRRP